MGLVETHSATKSTLENLSILSAIALDCGRIEKYYIVLFVPELPVDSVEVGFSRRPASTSPNQPSFYWYPNGDTVYSVAFRPKVKG
jgi:hypothetical protein